MSTLLASGVATFTFGREAMFWLHPLFSGCSCFGKFTHFTVAHFFFDMQPFLFFVIYLIFFHFFGRGIWSWWGEEKNMLTCWTEFWKEISERLKCPIVEWSNNIFFSIFEFVHAILLECSMKNSCTLVEKNKIRMSFSKVAFSGSAVRMISPWGWVIRKLDGHYPGRKDLAQFHDVWWDPQLSWQVDISSKSKEKVKARETQCIKDRICVPWTAIDGC